jgi:protein phosphatase
VLGGGSDDLAPEVYRGDLALGDTLLLCTDGLTKHLDEATVARLLAAGRSAEQTCRDLVEAANAAGGSDNVTVVVAHFRDSRQEQAAASARAEAAAPNGEHAVEAATAPAGARA